MTARGLSGVKLVTSDAHAGLVAAIGATLPRSRLAALPDALRRCRHKTHYTTNLMAITPKASWPWVRTLLHSVFDQPDAESVAAQYDRVVDALADKLPKVAEHLDGARTDLLAFTAFPRQIWRQIWSNNPRNLSTPATGGRFGSAGTFRPNRPPSIASTWSPGHLDPTVQVDGGVTDGHKVLNAVAGAGGVAVLVEGHVAHPVHAVLDAPVLVQSGSDGGGSGLLERQATDPVDHLDAAAAGGDDEALTGDADDWPGVRESRLPVWR